MCRLRRSLYGLKQASRQWNLEFCSKLTQFGLTQSAHDHCLFIKRSSKSFLALLVYVDDVLITGINEVDILHVKRFLNSVFRIKDLGYAKYFLGLEIARSPKGMFLHQRKYVLDILTDVGLLHAKTTSTPMQRGHKFSTNSPLIGEPDRYRRLIGRHVPISHLFFSNSANPFQLRWKPIGMQLFIYYVISSPLHL